MTFLVMKIATKQLRSNNGIRGAPTIIGGIGGAPINKSRRQRPQIVGGGRL